MNQVIAPSHEFRSFFIAGFECSSHRRIDGQRLDLLAITEHDVQAADDYRLAARYGMLTVRDGVRWHLIEPRPNTVDLSSFLPMLRAARDTGTQVIWDLMHYGWPDFYDIWAPDFADRFASFVQIIAQTIKDETDEIPWYTPVNEISFFAWAGGQVQYLNPFARERGADLKRILVRAAIAAHSVILEIDPRARFLTAEPLIHIHPRSEGMADIILANAHNEKQFEVLELLSGRREPELGGQPHFLDALGFNYYYNNQWIDEGRTVHLGDGRYRPLHHLLADAYARYRRPLCIAETGSESEGRASWLHYVCDAISEAQSQHIPVEAICLYPILNHRGWDDERYCRNGLFGRAEAGAGRTVSRPFATELERQQRLFSRLAKDN